MTKQYRAMLIKILNEAIENAEHDPVCAEGSKKILNNLYEDMRMKYDQLDSEEQVDLQQYYDDNLAEEWQDRVLEDGGVHYDDVDRIQEVAWEWYLEH